MLKVGYWGALVFFWQWFGLVNLIGNGIWCVIVSSDMTGGALVGESVMASTL